MRDSTSASLGDLRRLRDVYFIASPNGREETLSDGEVASCKGPSSCTLQPRERTHGSPLPLRAELARPDRVHAPARVAHPPLFRLAVLIGCRVEVLEAGEGEREERAQFGDLHGGDVGHLCG